MDVSVSRPIVQVPPPDQVTEPMCHTQQTTQPKRLEVVHVKYNSLGYKFLVSDQFSSIRKQQHGLQTMHIAACCTPLPHDRLKPFFNEIQHQNRTLFLSYSYVMICCSVCSSSSSSSSSVLVYVCTCVCTCVHNYNLTTCVYHKGVIV
jgi:hypothetical protein